MLTAFQNQQTYTRAVCWDFDQTIPNGHWHRALATAGIRPGNGTPFIDSLMNGSTIGDTEALPQPRGLKNPRELSLSMKRSLDKGVAVAIVSFTLYPEVIKPILLKLTEYADKGGLTVEDVEKIYIRGGFPSDNNPHSSPMGKKEHLLDVMAHFGITRKADIMLVDDTLRNCLICQGTSPTGGERIDPEAAGFQAVVVPLYPDPSLDYIHNVNNFVAPYTPDEIAHMKALAEEAEFIDVFNLVCERLPRLSLSTSRRSFKRLDPTSEFLEELETLKDSAISPSEKINATYDLLNKYKGSGEASAEFQYIIQTVITELSAKSDSPSRPRL